MVTEESLRKRYQKYTSSALATILVNKSDYTDIAVMIVREELLSRGVREVELANPKGVKRQAIDRDTRKYYLTDLMLWHKLLFYVIWLPNGIRSMLMDAIVRPGFILRSQQANYYSVTGATSLMLAICLGYYYGADKFFYAWAGAFVLVLLFDIGCNCKRLMRNLKKMSAKGEFPWGVA
ncbi:hypothetical protein [Mucilaginibacter myungsuensis]|uniref:Uncharacterized protein n=1 Tax=Mucilaginibacter myungsuensis TaxID=649104 RepID=A0A929KYR4_9SPHI|nr:hypothetical protein [Mucilaginibacter myungsuensis]MBE9663642.1 hypothetical protein [Mucilaginibacter myungsuensis]MDN3599034.1 hypothetical protein [Mucilaginibacter myungsuensis]